MTQPPSATWEFTLSLPLGVVDNQLRKVEDQLRALHMKAMDFGEHCEDRALRQRIATRLETIGGLVNSIEDLVTHIGADIQTRTRKPMHDQDD